MALSNGQYTVSGPHGYRKFRVKTQKPGSSFFGGRRLLTVEDQTELYGWRSFAEVIDQVDGALSDVIVFRHRERENQHFGKLFEALDKAGGEVTVDGRTYKMTVVRTCSVCNTKLVHPESIARGIGPECSGLGYANKSGKAAQKVAAA